MKQSRVLGIAGSPRRGGNTDLLLAEFMRGAASRGARVKTIVLNNLNITLCQHCDSCRETGNCRMQDGMQTVYDELEKANLIVLASPIQFMGVSSQTKGMIDRCLCLSTRKHILKIPPLSDKLERKGFFISVSSFNSVNVFEPAMATVKAFFHQLNITYAGDLLFRGVGEKGQITEHPDALRQALVAGQKLVEN